LPFLGMLAFAAAGLFSLRLVTAIARSGHLNRPGIPGDSIS